jgi:diguanylate cyclase (GGDEF)-like protein
LGSTVILKFAFNGNIDDLIQQQIFQAAIKDPLTGLYNQNYLLEQLTNEISYTRRHMQPVTLIMIDLDHFHLVNENFGASTGDAVLTSFAHLIKNTMRKEDLIVRYADDSFMLLCRRLDRTAGISVADRLRLKTNNTQLFGGLPDLKFTASVSLVTLPFPEIETVKQLIAAAKTALACAKKNGGNCIFHYAHLT